jgi:hypothetical protein
VLSAPIPSVTAAPVGAGAQDREKGVAHVRAGGVHSPAGDGGPAVAGPLPARRGVVIGAVTAMLRHVGKIAAGAVPVVALARLGLPALGALVFLAVLTAGVTCWLLGSDARADRVSRVLLAWRGNPGSPPADSPAANGRPAPRLRRWPWPRQP